MSVHYNKKPSALLPRAFAKIEVTWSYIRKIPAEPTINLENVSLKERARNCIDNIIIVIIYSWISNAFLSLLRQT